MAQKLTKIIATIGPSSDSEELIQELITRGADIIRFNFKHSDINWHKERIAKVQEVSKKINIDVATLLDLQGPEIRLLLSSDKIDVEIDEKILVVKDFSKKDVKEISFTNPEVINLLTENQKVFIDDGNFEFVAHKEEEKTYLISSSSGSILNRKTVNINDLHFDFPVIHERDRLGLQLAKDLSIDFIALSFVRSAEDLKTLRKEMDKINLDAKIVAKIETPKAIENIEEILDQTDAIMIARGDLGVEMPLEEVPFYQKEIIKKCIERGIPVITATQMLESMTYKKIPTRAEVSDVANAVYDFTDAVMLSGETANGEFPKEAVSVMAKVVMYSESRNKHSDIRTLFDYQLLETSQMVCDSAFNLYKVLKKKGEHVKGFIVFTQSGKTARMLSRYRPHSPIFAFCPKEDLVRKLSLSFGVLPIFQKSLREKDEIVKEDIKNALSLLKEYGFSKSEDLFIVLHGDYWTSESGTSTIRIVSSLDSL